MKGRHRRWPSVPATACAGSDSLGAEYLVEDRAEPLVPVTNQVLDRLVAA